MHLIFKMKRSLIWKTFGKLLYIEYPTIISIVPC